MEAIENQPTTGSPQMEFDSEARRTEEKMTTQKSKQNADLMCPECGAGPFADMRGRASHRHSAHGVKGTAAATLAYHKRQDELKHEGHAQEVKTKKKNHPKKTALVPAVVNVPGTVEVKPPEISVAMLGYAMGRLESLATQIARENNLPEKEFVKQVAANLAELTRR